jgi:hypothetical protein
MNTKTKGGDFSRKEKFSISCLLQVWQTSDNKNSGFLLCGVLV